MKILILGFGYLGKYAAELFKSEGHEVTITSRLPKQGGSPFPLLFWNEATAENFLDDFDYLLFAAGADSPQAYEETYLRNSEKISHAALKSARLKQIVYTGSCAVYGDHRGAVVNEESTLKPSQPNHHILIKTESTLLDIPSCAVAILRLGEIIGPGRMPLDRLRKIQGLTLPGSGDSPANFSPVEQILKVLEYSLNNRLQGIFNVVSDDHPTRRHLYASLAKSHGLQPPQWDPSLSTPHGGNRIVSNNKLETLLKLI